MSDIYKKELMGVGFSPLEAQILSDAGGAEVGIVANLSTGTSSSIKANNSSIIQSAANNCGNVTLQLPPGAIAQTIYISSAISLSSNTTLTIGPGITLDASAMSVPCITATSKSNIRLCGDGKIVCAAASVPTFTSCTGLEVSVRIEDGSGNALLPALSLCWVSIPSIWRLRLTGTGTCTMDAKDSLGNITANVATFSATSATDQIEFPYAGDDAVSVRFTLTGTCIAGVL